MLERVVRRRCSEFIKLDGTVVKPFKVRKRDYERGRRISSLEDLTRFHEERIAQFLHETVIVASEYGTMRVTEPSFRPRLSLA